MVEASKQDAAPWNYDPNMSKHDAKDVQPYFTYDWTMGTTITVTRRGWRTQFIAVGIVYLLFSFLWLALGLFELGVVNLLLGVVTLYSLRWMKEEIGAYKMLILLVLGLIVYVAATAFFVWVHFYWE